MADEDSKVVPFRRPSTVADGTTTVAAPVDPVLQVEFERLQENLRELDDADVAQVGADVEPADEPPTVVATAATRSEVQFEPHELERRNRLLHWSAEDDACLANEAAFRRRFGFTRNRRQRFQVLCLRHEDDLTEDEVRLLWRTGDLTFNETGAHNTAWRAAELLGRVLVAFSSVVLTFGFIQLLRQHPRLLSVAALGQFLLGAAMLIALIWGVNRFYISPSQIRRRARRAQAQLIG